jgi:AbrB family looped-hinge helix DNA binding protein
MTAVLSPSGDLLIPKAVREQIQLEAGDDFDVMVEDDDTIVLRRTSAESEPGWLEVLMACPGPLEIPEREKEDSPPLEL